MSGSRKGERRGGAKPGHVRKPTKLVSGSTPKKRGFGTGAGRSIGTSPKSKFDPVLGVILNKQLAPLEKERELEMYFLVVGKRMRLPKEVMIDAMQYFEQVGIDWCNVVRENMKMLGGARTLEARQVFERAIEFAESRVTQYILMAVDVAYKAAPYVHPRLAAVVTNPGGDRSAGTLLDILMRDLDEAGKPARYIDHDASEAVKP